jgi:hypothetical protein
MEPGWAGNQNGAFWRQIEGMSKSSDRYEAACVLGKIVTCSQAVIENRVLSHTYVERA